MSRSQMLIFNVGRHGEREKRESPHTAHEHLIDLVIEFCLNSLLIIIYMNRMIAASTLESIEDKSGYLYGVNINNTILYLGISTTKVNSNTGLVACTSPKSDNSPTRLQIQKKQVTKNNTVKFYKQYTLYVDGEMVKQVPQREISKILSEYAILELADVSEYSDKVFGYQYQGQLFKVGEEQGLFNKVR